MPPNSWQYSISRYSPQTPAAENGIQQRELVQPFKALSRLKQPVGEGAVLCLCKQTVPLAQDVDAVPVGVI